MSSLYRLLAKLIPFASPGTPLAQDLLYSAAIAACAIIFLYERFQSRSESSSRNAGAQTQATDELRNSEEEAVEPADDEAQVVDGLGDPVEDDPHIPRGRAAGNEDGQGPMDRGHLRDDNAGEGPADGPAQNLPPDRSGMPQQRHVGAKKAKSLAKKDQKRAYHEFMGNQGRAQRAQEAEGAAEREAQLAAERAKRAAAEAKIEARKAQEREARRAAEAKEREWEARRRTEPVELVRGELARCGMCSLWRIVEILDDLDLDVEFVEKLLKLAGVLGKGAAEDGAVTLLTDKGWVVKVEASDMQAAYKLAAAEAALKEDGRIPYGDLASILQSCLTKKTLTS